MSTFESAWAAYRAAERRLPPAPAGLPAPQWVDGLRPLLALGRYDAIVLDAWGVLNLGEAPIGSAVAAFQAIRDTGVPLRILSNDGSSDPEAAAARHTRRGFPVRSEEIVFGLDLLADALATLHLSPRRCALIAPRPAPFAAVTAEMLDFDTPAASDADAFVYLSTVGYTPETHTRLESLLRARPRPLLVGNPDIVSPSVDGLEIEPGHFAHLLADATGVEPVFLGKPSPAIYTRLLKTLPPHLTDHPERVLCVGDTPHTDILGAAAAGHDTLLVLGGLMRGAESPDSAVALCEAAGLRPTWVAPEI